MSGRAGDDRPDGDGPDGGGRSEGLTPPDRVLPADLGAAMDELSGELEDVVRRETGEAVEYERAGSPFAARVGARLSFRLRPEVVAAALRTPDTAASARGADWIDLAPAEIDDYAVDRTLAWFESAWRRAGESGPPRGRPH